MNRLIMLLLLIMFVMSVPLVALASSDYHSDNSKHGEHHDMKHEGHEHGEHHDMKHESHEHGEHHDMHADSGGHGDMSEIGKVTEDGVTAKAMIMVYDSAAREAMAKAGQDATHHLMVYFTDAKTGQPISSGKAAVKVKSHGGEDSKPLALMQMGEGFGGDVNLPAGHYELEVGTKLEDGKKRKFEYDYMTK